jgi:hypothetical protein
MASGCALLDAHKVLALPIRFDAAVTPTERRQVRAALKQGRFSLSFASNLRGGVLTTEHATFRPGLQELSNAVGHSRRWCVAVVDVPTHADLMVQTASDRSVVKVASIAQHLVVLRACSVDDAAADPSAEPTASTSGLLTRVTHDIAKYWTATNNTKAPVEAKVQEMESWIKRFKDHKLFDEAFEITYAPSKSPGGIAAEASSSHMTDECCCAPTPAADREEMLVWRWRELTPEGAWKDQRTEIRAPLPISCIRDDLRTNKYTFVTKTGKRVGQIGVTVHGVFCRYERGNGGSKKHAREDASARAVVAPATHDVPASRAAQATLPAAPLDDLLTADIEMLPAERAPATASAATSSRMPPQGASSSSQQQQRQQQPQRRSQRQSKRLRVSYADNNSPGTDNDEDDDSDSDADGEDADADGAGDEEEAEDEDQDEGD